MNNIIIIIQTSYKFICKWMKDKEIIQESWEVTVVFLLFFGIFFIVEHLTTLAILRTSGCTDFVADVVSLPGMGLATLKY